MKPIWVAMAVLLAAVSARADDCVLLEYLESTGSQYIDTEYVFTTLPRVETRAMLKTASDFDVAGTAHAAAAAGCFLVDYAGSKFYYRYGNVNYKTGTSSVALKDNWVDYVWTTNLIHNGIVQATETTYDFSGNTQHFYLFGSGRSKSSIRFQRVKMYDNDVLVRDLFPATVDDVPGLYDAVNGVFYTNAGTGAFTTGPVLDGVRLTPEGELEYRVTVTNNADEAILSLDGGATWIANTNLWLESGASVTATLKPDARGRFALFGSAGKGTWDRAAGTFTVTVTEPMTILAREAASYTWTGGSGFFDDPAHWTGGMEGTVPYELDTVTFGPAASLADAYTVTVTNPLVLAAMTVTGDIAYEETPDDDIVTTVKFKTGLATNTLGTITVNGAGKVTHEPGGTAETQKLILHVTGNATVAKNGAITAYGAGYSKVKGPLRGDYAGGHAGDPGQNTGDNCYGSIRCPVTYGSGGAYQGGGGAVRLMVDGVLAVNGSVDANAPKGVKDYRMGGGGSVWVTCASLTGAGTIVADTGSGGIQGGGGRVSVNLTDPTATFAAFTGSFHAYGNGGGTEGTVYLQTGAQEDGYGTLIFDRGNYGLYFGKTPVHTGIGRYVTETDVGDVIIRNKANPQIWGGYSLTVRGSLSIDSSSGLQCDADSTIFLASTNDCRLTGKLSASRLVCETPGKRIFGGTGSGDSLTILADGALTLRGTAEKPVELLPADGASTWKLTVNGGVVKDVSCASVSNCNSSAGYEVLDFGGTNLGGNANWKFPPPLVPGTTNTWTGATSSDTGVSSNWDIGRTPEPCDVIVIPAGTTHAPIITANATTFNTLVVDAGATLTLDGARLTVTNDLLVSGTLAVKGARTVAVGHDATFADATGFAPGSSTFTFAGAGAAHRLDAHGAAFHALELAADCGNVTFASGWTADLFRSRPGDAARTVTFASGALFAAEGWLLEGGSAGLSLAASGDTAWRMKVKHFAYVRGVTVAKSDAQTDGGLGVTAYGSSGTDTAGWTFASGAPFVWTGAASAVFGASGNWERGTAPGADDTAFVFANGTKAPVASVETTVGALVVGGGDAAVSIQFKTNLTVKGALQILAKGTATLDAPVTVQGDFRVQTDGKVTHTGPAETPNVKVDVTVAGNAKVFADGAVTADGAGYSKVRGPLVGEYAGGHAGDPGQNTGDNCYGSIRCPVTWGSVGTTTSGGGAVRLRVTGALLVDGRVSANGTSVATLRTGGGGSVWITCASLAGGGAITADTGDPADIKGGGGRVSVVLTDAAATFAAYTGAMHAYGYGGGTEGSVYCQTGAQEDGYGTLVFDRGNYGTFSGWKTVYTGIGRYVTEADVGDVIIRNKAHLYLWGGYSLTVRGSLTVDASSSFTCAADSTLVLSSTNDCTISGKISAYHLTCEAPGKRILVGTGAGTSLTVQENGSLTVKGSESKPVELLPADGSGTWTLKVNAGVTKAVQYANVSNSNASSGSEIASFGGTDLGGNTHWTFPEMVKPGETNTWTGAESSNPEAKGNWSRERTPEPGDVIVVPAGTENPLAITASATTYGSLVVESGAEVTVSGNALTVTNDLAVAGTLTAKGSCTITVGHDVTFATPASFVSGDSCVALSGAGARRVDAHGAAFHTLELAEGCGNVTFASGWTADWFVTPPDRARTLTFAGGALFASEGWMLDGGTDGAPGLTLASADATAWRMKVAHVAYARGVSVSGCDAESDGGCGVKAYESSGTGTNPGWTFASGDPFVWTGAASADFGAAGNWESGAAPGADDTAWIFANGTRAPVAATETTVGALVVGGGDAAASFKSTANLMVKGALQILAKGTATLDAPVTVQGDFRVQTDGKVTHTGPGTTPNARVDVTVAGDAKVFAGGAVTANGRGYTANNGPCRGNYAGGHGGDPGNNIGDKCYGSVRYPVTWGSGGSGNSGGGAVRLTVTGALRVDGSVTADAAADQNTRTGGGGSVWLTCGSLAGGGAITADTGDPGDIKGAGGRIAVKLTDPAATFDAFAGTMHTWGCGGGAEGTVYLQTGAQEDGYGTLILDRGNYGTYSGWSVYADIGANVTEADVGDVIIRNKGRLRVVGGSTLTVRGSISNGGTFTCDDDSTVLLAGTNDCRLSGSAFSFHRLTCETPGKTILFPTNKSQTVTVRENGTLAMTGTAEEPIRLVPAAGGEGDFWRLTLGAGVDRSLTWVAVSNSIASSSVTAFGSRDLDLGGNTNWTFKAIVVPGEPIVWTGEAGTSDMEDALNWDRERRPEKTDAVIIAPADVAPVLTAQDTLYNSLEIRPGATFTAAGSELVLTNGLVVNGTLAMSGAGTLRVVGNVAFGAQASFSAGSSVFSLTGGMERTVSAAGARFHTLELDPTCGNIAFSGSFGAETIYSRAGETVRTLTFADGTHVTANGAWLDGVIADEKGLTLTGPTDAARWRFDVNSWSFVRGVRVKGSDASHGTHRVTAYRPCLDEGGNAGWIFVTDRDPALWKGGTDLNFGTAANWAGGVVPGAEDAVYMPYTAGIVEMSAWRQTYRSFVIGGSGDGRTARFRSLHPFTVREDLHVLKGGTAILDAAVTVTGSVNVATGGLVTHTGPTIVTAVDVENAGVELAVGGDVNVAASGAISANGTGFSAQRGYSGGRGPAHGGLGSHEGGEVYGSLASPTNWGTGGQYSSGGGRIRIAAAGTVRTDGAISADGSAGDRSGSGGSVWITCAALAGTGRVSADGGRLSEQAWYAGGGRVAVETTTAAGTNAWTGVVRALGGNTGVGGTYEAGCGSVYWKLADEPFGTAWYAPGARGTTLGGVRSDAPRVARNVKVVLDGVSATLKGDWMLRDLDLRGKASLALEDKVLTIKSQVHKKGRGWSVQATVTSNTVEGVTGRIEWVPPGTVIVVK